MNKQLFKMLRQASFFVLGVLLLSCFPKGPEYVDELDVVVTSKLLQFDDLNQATFNSFYLPDTIVYINDGKQDGSIEEEDKNFILDKISEEMEAYGWVKFKGEDILDGEDTVDALLTVTVINDPNYQVNWWNYWYNIISYPTLAPSSLIYTFNNGSIVIQMGYLNPVLANYTEGSPPLWIGGINGFLEGGEEYIKNRVDSGIDRIFEESPYLNRN